MNIFNHTAGARNSVSWVCAIQLVPQIVSGVCAIYNCVSQMVRLGSVPFNMYNRLPQIMPRAIQLGVTKGVVGFMPIKMRPHWYGLGLYYTNGYNKWRATKLGARDYVAWAIQLGATNSEAGVCAIQVGVINW